MSLPITLIASLDKVYNSLLLISRASARYAISHYSYLAQTKCTPSYYSYRESRRSAPLVQLPRDTFHYIHIQVYIISTWSYINQKSHDYLPSWSMNTQHIKASSSHVSQHINYHTIIVTIFNIHHSSCSISNILQTKHITLYHNKISTQYNHKTQTNMCNIYLQLQTNKLRSHHSNWRTTYFR